MFRKAHQIIHGNPAPATPTTSTGPVNRVADLERLDLARLLALCPESRHDESLWNEFVRRSRPSIVASLIKSIRQWTNPTKALVEDLVQDTYLKLCHDNLKALQQLETDGADSLYGFLKVVASNVVSDHFHGAFSQKRGDGRNGLDLDQAQIVHAGTSRPAILTESMAALQDWDRNIRAEKGTCTEDTLINHELFLIGGRDDGWVAKKLVVVHAWWRCISEPDKRGLGLGGR